MNLYVLFLFVHLVTLAVLFGAMGVSHVAVHHLRASRLVAEARPWSGALRGLRLVFPIGSLVLIASGLALGGLRDMMGHGWLWTSIVGVFALLAIGLGVNAPWARRLGTSMAGAPEGALPEAARAALREPGIEIGLNANVGIVLGILFLMIAKPGALASVLIVAGAGLAGAAYGRWAAGRSTEPAAVDLAPRRQAAVAGGRRSRPKRHRSAASASRTNQPASR